MPETAPQKFDPTDGTIPVTLTTQDARCQSPCDPPWLSGPSCTTFTEIRSSTLLLLPPPPGQIPGHIDFSVTYTHTLCLIGKQQGGLAYTLTLLPGEKMTLYHSDRYRRTTSETQRYSVQTTFAQFVSALYQQQTSNNSSLLQQVLNNGTLSGSDPTSSGVNLFGLFYASTGGGSTATSSTSSGASLSVQAASDQFSSVAQQASQYTDVQRGITVSNYEDSETVATTQRTLTNNNICHAVTYYVRKIMDVYQATTTVTAVTFQVRSEGYVSPVLTPAQIDQVEPQLRAQAAKALKGLPAVGDVVQQPTVLAVPTDGVVYNPELSQCCVQDPELEQVQLIRLEREQAEAQKIGLELQLMALEVQRRQALLAAGTLTSFEVLPAPSKT
jgi:thermitase